MVDRAGNVVVADSSSHAVPTVNKEGGRLVSTFADNGETVYNPAGSADRVLLADSSSDVEEEDALPPRTLPAHLDITPANAACVSPTCLSIIVSRIPQR